MEYLCSIHPKIGAPKMPEFVEGVELTQEGMHAIFARMGHPDITSGSIYNGIPTIDKAKLDEQGFMPVLTGVGPEKTSGHWIMIIKGKGNNYHIFDPLGAASGNDYKDIISAQLPAGRVSVIPNEPDLNMGLCGYWVASAGLRAHAALNQDVPPSLHTLGQTISNEMRGELAANGYQEITGWLRAVKNKFPDGDPQPDATALRKATEVGLRTEVPVVPVTEPVSPVKVATPPPEIPTQPTVIAAAPVSDLASNLLESNEDVRNAILYVHKEYLGKPYPGPLVDLTDPSKGRLPPNEGPDRGTHGLAHTVRTMACSEVMVEEARKAKFRGEKLNSAKDGRTLADVTPDELKKILVAQAFFVVGRDDERSGYDEKTKRNFYEEYHKASEDAFRKYVADNNLIGTVFKDQKEVDFYAAIILDKPHNWDGSPAHILINQSHMVDLMRVKAPPEPVMERTFNTLKTTLGSRGAEVVLKSNRDFLLATGAVVSSYNPQAIDDPSRGGPWENPFSGEKYVIEEGKTPNTKKDMTSVKSSYVLKDNERFVSIKEYYAIPEVQKDYPGSKTRLDSSPYYEPTQFSRTCEKEPLKCISAILDVRSKETKSVINAAIQKTAETSRRKPNSDEIAAASIIQQILTNPDSIQDDHVLLNGQKLEEQFFRELLAKCDMNLVGALLDKSTIGNLDAFMQHQSQTEFHSTGEQAVPRKIGEEWARIRKASLGDIRQDLIFLMQNDSWYFSRVNAIAQNRDKGSSFKEVLITSLLTPLTSKALVEAHGKSSSPKKVYRGLDFSEDFKNKLLNQAQTVIANTNDQAFTDPSTEVFKLIKLNNTLSNISTRTNISSSTDINVPREIFDSNTIFEMHDPDGLLQPKKVGTHSQGSESEYSFYLPDDVALIPIKVTTDGTNTKGEPRHIFTFVAVKSPDFLPRHESGYAVQPFIKMQSAKLAEVTKAIQADADKYDDNTSIKDRVRDVRINMIRQFHLPVRDSIFDKISHAWSRTDDKKISVERKNFLGTKVLPVLQDCHLAILSNDVEKMKKALANFPKDSELSVFKSQLGVNARNDLMALKQQLEKRVLLQTQVLPFLNDSKIALDGQNVENALGELAKIQSGVDQRADVIKQELTQSLSALKEGVTAPLIIDAEKVKVRYEALLANITEEITDIEKVKPSSADSMNKAMASLNNLQEELKLLRNEKVRMHTDTEHAVEFSDIEPLEARVQVAQAKLVPALLAETSVQVATLEVIPKDRTVNEIKTKTKTVHDSLAAIEFLRTERIKNHGDSKEPLDMSDLDGLKDRVHAASKGLVGVLLSSANTKINNFSTTKDLKKETEDLKLFLDMSAQLEKSLDRKWVIDKQIATILESAKPKVRTFAEVNEKISIVDRCLKEIELERAERIKQHGESPEPLDMSDLDGLKKRAQDAGKELAQIIVVSAKASLDKIKDPESFEKASESITNHFDILSKIDKTLGGNWVMEQQIASMLETVPKIRSVSEINSKILIISKFQETIESERAERIKKHGDSQEPLDLSDLDALKERLQAASRELGGVLLSSIEISLDKIKDPVSLENETVKINEYLEIFSRLEKTLDTSEASTLLKAGMLEHKALLVEKQEKAFPQMIQLQFKSEALIMQLRAVCDLHKVNLDEAKRAELAPLDNRWGIANALYYDTEGDRAAINMKYQQFSAFRFALNDPAKNVDQIITYLAGKDAATLEKSLGLSEENAEQLHELVNQLKTKTADTAELTERSKAIDELSTDIGRTPVAIVVPEHEDVVDEQRRFDAF